MTIRSIKDFIRLESSSGIILFMAAVLALVIDNSPWREYYRAFFAFPLSVHIGVVNIDKPLQMWINDGLMTLFFLLVGLQIKQEIHAGELDSLAKTSLPLFAAIGGMVVPALFYVVLNWGDAVALRGWAIPTATDIAFSLGILSLFGSRIQPSLRVFLTALAIFDDIGAIVIIAFFYTSHISFLLLLVSVVLCMILYVLNRVNITAYSPYIIIGLALWVCVLKSGVHATLVGVVLAMAIPIKAERAHVSAPAKRMSKHLHPWVAFGILPIFAFANSGVSFAGAGTGILTHPVTLGILLGLFLGKQLGIFLFSATAIKLGLSAKPRGMSALDLYGVSLVAGIGFTMSLFIGGLAFEFYSDAYAPLIRVGVLLGSISSGALGYYILRLGILRREGGQVKNSWLLAKAKR